VFIAIAVVAVVL